MRHERARGCAGRFFKPVLFLCGLVLCPIGAPAQSPERPAVTSVSPIRPTDKQTIIIRGSGFGTQDPFNGYSRFLRLTDLAQGNWVAGWAPDNNPLNAQAPIYVTEWTDNEITIEGFPRYGGKWTFKPGDVVKIEVANPEGQGLPYANDPNASKASVGVFSVRVTDATADAVGPTETSPTAVVRPTIRDGETSLRLSGGREYLYGMVTGGAQPSTPFANGPVCQASDVAGQIGAALAYGIDDMNSYSTQTGYHVIGGVPISGSWDTFSTFCGLNPEAGASNASVSFVVSEESLVVVIGLASSQQSVSLNGIASLHTDVSNSGPQASEAMVISHAYLQPGAYTVSERSAALSAGQDPNHMADLIGVFVFGHKH